MPHVFFAPLRSLGSDKGRLAIIQQKLEHLFRKTRKTLKVAAARLAALLLQDLLEVPGQPQRRDRREVDVELARPIIFPAETNRHGGVVAAPPVLARRRRRSARGWRHAHQDVADVDDLPAPVVSFVALPRVGKGGGGLALLPKLRREAAVGEMVASPQEPVVIFLALFSTRRRTTAWSFQNTTARRGGAIVTVGPPS